MRSRRLLGVPAVALGLAALTGCGSAGSDTRALQVQFTVPTGGHVDRAQVVAALRACPGSKAVKPQPISTSTIPAAQVYPLTYDARTASDLELNRTIVCLDRQPGVVSAYLEAKDY